MGVNERYFLQVPFFTFIEINKFHQINHQSINNQIIQKQYTPFQQDFDLYKLNVGKFNGTYESFKTLVNLIRFIDLVWNPLVQIYFEI